MALWEDDGRVVLELEVPGISQDDLEVQVEAGMLTVAAKRDAPAWPGKLKHNEHRHGDFLRRVRLDESLDPTSVEADLQNGVLTLTIRRRVEAQPVKVAVRVRERESAIQSDEGLSDASTAELGSEA